MRREHPASPPHTSPDMKGSRKATRPELLCIICSDGARDRNGAYTVCALCTLADAAVPSEVPAAA